MLTNKPAAKILAVTLMTGSVLGLGTAAFGETAHAADRTTVSSSITNPEAAKTVDNLYDDAFQGEMPNLVNGLKINVNTKSDVHEKIGLPEEPANTANAFDRYHGSMGQASYAFSYNENGTIAQIRYFGTNVERQLNLGGVTPAVLSEQIGSPREILNVPDTNQFDYVYQTGDYSLHFVVGADQTVDHVNLVKTK